MILISDEQYLEMQQKSLEEEFKDFFEKLDEGSLVSADFDKPKTYILEIVSLALIGYQNYANLYNYVNNIILDDTNIKFFSEPHTKQEVRDFVSSIN